MCGQASRARVIPPADAKSPFHVLRSFVSSGCFAVHLWGRWHGRNLRVKKKYSIPLWRKEMFLLATLTGCAKLPQNCVWKNRRWDAPAAAWFIDTYPPSPLFFFLIFIFYCWPAPTPHNVSDVADILPTHLLCLELKWRLLLLAPLSGTNGFHWPGLIPHKALQRSNHRPGPG